MKDYTKIIVTNTSTKHAGRPADLFWSLDKIPRISLHTDVADQMPARLHLTNLRLKRWPFRLRATLLSNPAGFNLNCRVSQD